MSNYSNKTVVSVRQAGCDALAGLRRTSVSSVFASGIDWHEIGVIPHGSLVIETKIEDKVTLYTATLKFRTCEDYIPSPASAYLVGLKGGGSILIGTGERPYPVGTYVDSHPEKGFDSQSREITVSWTSACPIPAFQE